jgi:hypothetical protein
VPSISNYSVQYWNDGSWREIVKSDKAGITQAHQFHELEATRVRINVSGVAGEPPSLAEFGIYYEPGV